MAGVGIASNRATDSGVFSVETIDTLAKRATDLEYRMEQFEKRHMKGVQVEEAQSNCERREDLDKLLQIQAEAHAMDIARLEAKHAEEMQKQQDLFRDEMAQQLRDAEARHQAIMANQINVQRKASADEREQIQEEPSRRNLTPSIVSRPLFSASVPSQGPGPHSPYLGEPRRRAMEPIPKPIPRGGNLGTTAGPRKSSG
eukprot:TRINITY_DN10997_c0_g1_i1.p1 TRINITY_DN10997_c0_g1~~TRINITY_DN10997_c0_g1_i1.p1  ORF type:complete len:222 (-),score=33.11 TRINITY_DN10997_c0_g1_i1:123-722(-)